MCAKEGRVFINTCMFEGGDESDCQSDVSCRGEESDTSCELLGDKKEEN